MDERKLKPHRSALERVDTPEVPEEETVVAPETKFALAILLVIAVGIVLIALGATLAFGIPVGMMILGTLVLATGVLLGLQS